MRTKYCGDIHFSDLNKKVILCGWVVCKRNFGNFIFIDMRDYTGIIQIFCKNNNTSDFHNARKLKNEFCIQVTGIVAERAQKNKNKTIKTGELEIISEKIIILNSAIPLPLNIHNIDDDKIRFKYRYLDLRRSKMFKNLKIRNDIIDIIRIFMKKNNFLNIDTPILTKSTPEGAKDYLISSRIHKEKYYALPQSPQLFKQLLMISGIDRYYQIAKCFRDEDLRSDRQPEFTQIDVEAAFVDGNTIQKIIESMVMILWEKILHIQLKKFPVISFQDAINTYGSDKPDLRNPLKFISIPNNTIDYYHDNIKNIKTLALVIPNGTKLFNQNTINTCNHFIETSKNIDYMYICVENIKLKKYNFIPANKIIKIKNMIHIINLVNAKDQDIIYILSGKKDVIYKILTPLRMIFGKAVNIITKNSWKPVWIINFPLFKKNNTHSLSSTHHPFTAPKNTTIQELQSKPESIISSAYDLVINGNEIGGGSVRIHDKKTQETVFKILGILNSKNKNTLKFFINALQYGTPPHAGIALGLDRIAMLLTNSKNIKDVIAFPKTNSAQCLMTGSPTKITY
ncbi:aspartate--tRNA ligase [Buchnera aphidicola]|uniref:aspartate--tRNA ligase n=1 Tax=Buchnera aphidicola TaxID=9 RepID=UPI0034644449